MKTPESYVRTTVKRVTGFFSSLSDDFPSSTFSYSGKSALEKISYHALAFNISPRTIYSGFKLAGMLKKGVQTAYAKFVK